MRRLLAVLVTVVGAAVLLSGCGSSSAKPGDPANTNSAHVVVDISIEDGAASPNGKRVDVPLGSPVSLSIHADDDGEIHIHSTPEQEIEYHPGTTQAYLGRFTVPGQVTVESHTLGTTLVILVVQ